MAYNYHNWGLAGAAQRKYGNRYYDAMLMWRELGFLLKLIICIFILLTAVISIPVLLIVFICWRSQDKRERKLYSSVEQGMMILDTATYEDFSKNVSELIKFCVENKYKFPLTDAANYTFTFKQSIEKLGIKDMREIFGTEVVLHRVLVTNREVTPQGREFCNSAYITILDRNNLIEMLAFKASK